MNQLLLAKQLNMLANPALGNVGEWQERHNAAVSNPKGCEVPMVTMITGWLLYAVVYKTRYDSTIGQDGFLGDYWAGVGRSLTAMLNGECGRLDCGTLEGLIRDTLTGNGIEDNS